MARFFQITGILFSVFLLAAFLAPIPVGGIINVGNCAGLLFALLLLAYCIWYRRVHQWVRRTLKKKMGRVLISTLAIILAAALLFLLYTGYCMLMSLNNLPDGTETVVVLGCQVQAHGPSLMLWERIDAAYAYLTAHPEAMCILSGGKGADEPMSEAECMRRELVARGISTDRLIKENQSTSTRENLEFSKAIIAERNLSPRVAIVTNNFHMYRAGNIATELGIKHAAIPAKTMAALLPTYTLREVFGVLYELIF